MNANTADQTLNTSKNQALPRSERRQTDAMERHGVQDQRSMTGKLFGNPQRYTRLLQAQYAFLRELGAAWLRVRGRLDAYAR